MSNKTIEERDNFRSRFGALMAITGMAIGLGNVWRFPYVLGEYGGGTFLIAYIIVLLAIVIPLAIVEMGIGKGIGKGNIDVYADAFKSKTAGKAIGGTAAVLYTGMNFFFITIIGISVYYMYVSLVGLWNNTPPQEIYDSLMANKALLVVLFSILCAMVSYTVYKGIGKGVESASKFMVPGIFLFFGIIIVYSWTIDGIAGGYEFLLAPEWGKLASLDLWIAAIGQALFSVGVGPGCILVYGSHLKKTDDVSLNAVTISFLDTSAALIAGLAIIPPCIALGLDPGSGAQLIFVVLPSLFSMIPGGQILGFLVFTAIFFAGITSAVAQLEVPVTTFSDGLGWSRKKSVTVFTILTVVCSIPAIYNEALLKIFSDVAGNYGFIITAGLGAITYVWIYGVRKIREDFINPSSDIKLAPWFDVLVKFVVTPIMIFILINAII